MKTSIDQQTISEVMRQMAFRSHKKSPRDPEHFREMARRSAEVRRQNSVDKQKKAKKAL